MSGSLNRVTLIGNVGKDPEIRSMNSGDKVANFSIACTESWKDKASGEKKERTEWVNIVVWGDGLIGVLEKYVSKGSKLYVEGKLQTRKWEDQDGKDRYTTEVVIRGFDGQVILLGDPKGGSDSSQQNRGGGDRGAGGYDRSSSGGSYGGGGHRESFSADLDDEIPFISMGYTW